MNHYAAPDFWVCYQRLPSTVKQAADRAFARLKDAPTAAKPISGPTSGPTSNPLTLLGLGASLV